MIHIGLLMGFHRKENMRVQPEKSRRRYLFDKKTHFKYLRLMKTLNNSLRYESSDPAKFKLHCLEYAEEFGVKAALAAFNLKRSTLYSWRKRYLDSRKKLVSLVPRSTRPHTTRQMEVDWRLVEFIRAVRKEYGNEGSHIIKPFLDEYAKKLGITTISYSTIEKVIRRRKLTFEKRSRPRRKVAIKPLRTRKSPRVGSPGYIEIDTIEIRLNKHKYYFVSIIDIFTRFAYVELLSTKSAKETKEALERFRDIYCHIVIAAQTDNGSEFFKEFHEYLETEKIKHIFIYPNSPKLNGVVERFNRTIQEEFINRSRDFGYNNERFNTKLTSYLNWYNCHRPHSSLGYQSPMQFIQASVQ